MKKPLQELRVNSGFGGIALRYVRVNVMVHVYDGIMLKSLRATIICSCLWVYEGAFNFSFEFSVAMSKEKITREKWRVERRETEKSFIHCVFLLYLEHIMVLQKDKNTF